MGAWPNTSAVWALLGFDVVVDDPMAERELLSRGVSRDRRRSRLWEACTWPADYVVVATQHKGDHQSMLWALRSLVPFIALIASRKRSGLVLDYLRAEGVGEAALARAPSEVFDAVEEALDAVAPAIEHSAERRLPSTMRDRRDVGRGG